MNIAKWSELHDSGNYGKLNKFTIEKNKIYNSYNLNKIKNILTLKKSICIL